MHPSLPGRFFARCLGALAVLVSISCAGGEERAEPPVLRPTTNVAATDIDPVDPETGVEASCLFEKRHDHPDPDSLIAEFLRRDAAGDFLRSNSWFDGATECPGHEPGPDQHTAIARYQTRVASRSDSLAAVEVTTLVLGAVTYTEFIPGITTLVDTLVARRTPFGWRLTGHVLRQHVLASVVLERGRLPASQTEVLRRTLTAAR
jgi:hypothetical protein